MDAKYRVNVIKKYSFYIILIMVFLSNITYSQEVYTLKVHLIKDSNVYNIDHVTLLNGAFYKEIFSNIPDSWKLKMVNDNHVIYEMGFNPYLYITDSNNSQIMLAPFIDLFVEYEGKATSIEIYNPENEKTDDYDLNNILCASNRICETYCENRGITDPDCKDNYKDDLYCGDHICSPEMNENEYTCKPDCVNNNPDNVVVFNTSTQIQEHKNQKKGVFMYVLIFMIIVILILVVIYIFKNTKKPYIRE